MAKKTDVIEWIRHDHENMRQGIELLDRYLFHLRYEGKKNAEENLKRTQEQIHFLEKDMDRRIRYEEEILFPFLAIHIPRFQPLLNLLRSDHEKCRHEFKYLSDDIRKVSMDEVLKHGEYLTDLLRSHWDIEDQSAIMPLSHELKIHEKDRLGEKWKRYGKIKQVPAS